MFPTTETLTLSTGAVLSESKIGEDGMTDAQRKKHGQSFLNRVVGPLSDSEEDALEQWLKKKRAA